MTLKSILDSRKLTFYSSLICVALISLYIHWLPPFMIAWVVFWIAENRKDFNLSEALSSKQGKLFILFFALLLWQTIGIIYAESFDSGMERIVKRISFLLFPLVLFYPGGLIIKNIKTVLKVFAISSVIYILYCFGNAIESSITIQNGVRVFYAHPPLYTYESFFFGAYLSDLVHPTYMSMFVIMALIISFESVFDSSQVFMKRVFWGFCSLLFIIVIYLLSSRAGILSAIIVIPLYLLIRLSRIIPKYLIWLFTIMIVIGSVFILKTNSRINYSFEDIKKENLQNTMEKNVRFVIWKSAFGVIKDNFLFGVGTGDASGELKEEFLNRGYKDGYYDNMNSHNQFIEIFIENGIIGLLIFLAIIGYISYIGITEQNILFGLFLIMMIVFFMFETLLNRLSGVTFFPLFTFLLLHYKQQTLNIKSHL